MTFLHQSIGKINVLSELFIEYMYILYRNNIKRHFNAET